MKFQEKFLMKELSQLILQERVLILEKLFWGCAIKMEFKVPNRNLNSIPKFGGNF